MKESTLQRNIIRALEAEYGEHIDVTNNHGGPYSRAGLEDLTCGLYGRAVYIEVKQPGQKPTILQHQRMKAHHRAGCTAEIAHSPEEAIDICRAALRRPLPAQPDLADTLPTATTTPLTRHTSRDYTVLSEEAK